MLFCRWLNYKKEPMQKSIGGIEAQKLNLALNPPLRKTDVQATPPVSDIQQSTLITFFIYYLTVKI